MSSRAKQSVLSPALQNARLSESHPCSAGDGTLPPVDAQVSRRPQSGRAALKPNACTDVLSRHPKNDMQVLYALLVHGFLERSRMHFALQYTGSRHGYPQCGHSSLPAGPPHRARMFQNGDKHVVG